MEDPKTYTKTMLDIDSKKWQETMKSEMDSMYANQVWTLVDPPEGIVPIGNKWVFKRKKGSDVKAETYKARLASRSCNICFDEAIKGYGFSQNEDEPCVYRKNSGSVVVFLVLYVDDILMFGNNIGMLTSVKLWLSKTFSMKDLGNASYILGINIYRDISIPSVVKTVLKYLKRDKDMFLVYGGNPELLVEGNTNSDFEYDVDDRKSTIGYVFTLNGGAISWRCCK
ncbi:unnamed protein product [Prunus brigantina]